VRRSVAVAVAILGATATTARGEPKRLGVDATLGVPLGDWSRATGIGGGGSVWLHVPVATRVDVIARIGAIVHATRPVAGTPTASARLTEVPMVGGARYRLTDGSVRGYLEGEVGVVFRRVDVDVASVSDASSRIRLASALGAALEVDRFDVRVAAWLADLSDVQHEVGVLASVGVRVYAF
jgi:hypothetical protein